MSIFNCVIFEAAHQMIPMHKITIELMTTQTPEADCDSVTSVCMEPLLK
jgi:hypothetical protein